LAAVALVVVVAVPGLSRRQYVVARDALVSRGLVEVEDPGGGRGHPPVVLI
jgi:hypothetical protein